MKRTAISLMATGLLVSTLGGCAAGRGGPSPQRSVYGLELPYPALVQEGLVGSWSTPDGEITWTFKRAVDEADEVVGYDLLYREGVGAETEGPVSFSGRLVEIGEFLLLDVLAGDPPIQNELYRYHHLPTHLFFGVELNGDHLTLRPVDEKRVEALVGDGGLTFEQTASGRLLTTSQADLNIWILEHGEAVFGPGVELDRQ